jgi:hypothetical protein
VAGAGKDGKKDGEEDQDKAAKQPAKQPANAAANAAAAPFPAAERAVRAALCHPVSLLLRLALLGYLYRELGAEGKITKFYKYVQPLPLPSSTSTALATTHVGRRTPRAKRRMRIADRTPRHLTH